MMAVYDDTAAIGKLYRRQDEIGTPWCVTVDVDSLEDGAVTVRDRDSMTQERVPVEGVTRLILDRLEAARASRPVATGDGGGRSPRRDRGRRRGLARRRWTPRQRATATFPFDAAERFVWQYTPGSARGPGPRRHAARPAGRRDGDRRRRR